MEIKDGAYYYGKPRKESAPSPSTRWMLRSGNSSPCSNATLIKMGWKEPWDMSQGEKSASQLKGVTLEKGHVMALDLSNQQLAGDLPATAFVLPKLESLNISHNRFKGNVGRLGKNASGIDITRCQLQWLYRCVAYVACFHQAAQHQQPDHRQDHHAVDGSHFNINAIIPQLPTILAYDHEKQGYNTSEIGFLITQSDADNWYRQVGHARDLQERKTLPCHTSPLHLNTVARRRYAYRRKTQQ